MRHLTRFLVAAALASAPLVGLAGTASATEAHGCTQVAWTVTHCEYGGAGVHIEDAEEVYYFVNGGDGYYGTFVNEESYSQEESYSNEEYTSEDEYFDHYDHDWDYDGYHDGWDY